MNRWREHFDNLLSVSAGSAEEVTADMIMRYRMRREELR